MGISRMINLHCLFGRGFISNWGAVSPCSIHTLNFYLSIPLMKLFFFFFYLSRCLVSLHSIIITFQKWIRENKKSQVAPDLPGLTALQAPRLGSSLTISSYPLLHAKNNAVISFMAGRLILVRSSANNLATHVKSPCSDATVSTFCPPIPWIGPSTYIEQRCNSAVWCNNKGSDWEKTMEPYGYWVVYSGQC